MRTAARCTGPPGIPGRCVFQRSYDVSRLCRGTRSTRRRRCSDCLRPNAPRPGGQELHAPEAGGLPPCTTELTVPIVDFLSPIKTSTSPVLAPATAMDCLRLGRRDIGPPAAGAPAAVQRSHRKQIRIRSQLNLRIYVSLRSAGMDEDGLRSIAAGLSFSSRSRMTAFVA